VRNLDDLPIPARDLLTLDSYHHRGAIVSSRGCPIGCDFCSCSAITGGTYRTRSIPHVVELIKPNNNGTHLGWVAFTSSAIIKTLLSIMKNECKKPLKIIMVSS
jgi:radical SAM superfamily enzyme YgiQ (UPF0313 family)